MLGTIHKFQHSWVYKLYTFSLPPQKKYTSTFLSAKNPHENNKNQAKKLKCMEKMLIYTDPPLRKYGFILVKMLTFMDGPLSDLWMTCWNNSYLSHGSGLQA